MMVVVLLSEFRLKLYDELVFFVQLSVLSVTYVLIGRLHVVLCAELATCSINPHN